MPLNLSRAVFFNRLGELRDRSFENQRYRASGLNLGVAAIVLWHMVYLARSTEALREHGQEVDDKLLQHLSLLGWEHINLTVCLLNSKFLRAHFFTATDLLPVEAGVDVLLAVQPVLALAAIEEVITHAPSEHIIANATQDPICPLLTLKPVSARLPLDAVVA
jgi:Tn3 transposase DDE domain